MRQASSVPRRTRSDDGLAGDAEPGHQPRRVVERAERLVVRVLRGQARQTIRVGQLVEVAEVAEGPPLGREQPSPLGDQGAHAGDEGTLGGGLGRRVSASPPRSAVSAVLGRGAVAACRVRAVIGSSVKGVKGMPLRSR